MVFSAVGPMMLLNCRARARAPARNHGERLRDLGFAQSAEVAHFDHLLQARVGMLRFQQRVIDTLDVLVGRGPTILRNNAVTSLTDASRGRIKRVRR
jgi:hypothetical protein